MRDLAALYVRQFQVTLAVMLQYRAAMVIWMIGHVIEPLVYLVVWSTVSGGQGGRIGDYSTGEFAAYFIVLMIINHTTFTWIMWEFEYRIKHGSLSFALLRPVHPIHADVADNVSYKLITLPLMFIIAGGMAAIFRPAFSLVPWACLAFIPVLGLAFLIRFLLEWTLAQAAFWTTRVTAINHVYHVVLLFLAGQVAPLTLFPAPVQVLADILPFRYMVGFPVELLLGRLTPTETLTGIAAQVAWLVAGFVLMRLVWRAGIGKYSAVGA